MAQRGDQPPILGDRHQAEASDRTRVLWTHPAPE
jgi:hypothetical protein